MKVGLLAGLSLLAAAKAADALKKPNIVFVSRTWAPRAPSSHANSAGPGGPHARSPLQGTVRSNHAS